MSGRLPRLRTAIGAVLPQDPQRRLARPVRRRQTSHKGWPAAVRMATGLTLLQPLQGSASCQTRHLWQAPPPSPRNSGFPVRPQDAHAGTARAEPRLISSAASLPATGGAPLESAPGSAASAVASWSSACPAGAAARTAARTTGRGSAPSAATASSTT